MIDGISRPDLKAKIKQNKSAWIKCANKKQIVEGVEYLIDTMPRLPNQDCNRCVVSKPTREWHDVKTSLPRPLEDVLIKTTLGFVFIAQYNNGGWLVHTMEDGKQTMWVLDEPVTEWRLID